MKLKRGTAPCGRSKNRESAAALPDDRHFLADSRLDTSTVRPFAKRAYGPLTQTKLIG
jgi:hypothetical protein